MWKQAQSSEGKGAYLPPLFKSLELLWQPKSDTHRYNLQNLNPFKFKILSNERITKQSFGGGDWLSTIQNWLLGPLMSLPQEA